MSETSKSEPEKPSIMIDEVERIFNSILTAPSSRAARDAHFAPTDDNYGGILLDVGQTILELENLKRIMLEVNEENAAWRMNKISEKWSEWSAHNYLIEENNKKYMRL